MGYAPNQPRGVYIKPEKKNNNNIFFLKMGIVGFNTSNNMMLSFPGISA